MGAEYTARGQARRAGVEGCAPVTSSERIASFDCAPRTLRLRSGLRRSAQDAICLLEGVSSYYEFIQRVYREDFDPVEAARLEVNWWGIHRQFFGRSDNEEVIDGVAKLYAATYRVPYESVRKAAHHRAQAMVYSDRWVNEGRVENSPLLAQEEDELVKSYTALREAVSAPGGEPSSFNSLNSLP